MLASALGVVIVSILGGLIMFIIMIAMVAAIGSSGNSSATAVMKGSILSVDLGRISGDRTPGGLMASLGESKSTGLIDAERAILAAIDDDKIAGLLISDPGTSTLSWGSMTELRDAISRFRSSGKPVVSYATSYSQEGYYLCSAADRVCLHPAGMVDFRGIGAEVMYYKDLFDKLGVEMQLIRPESCTYKSAGEVYTMNHMSEANREQLRAYIASIWSTATEAIATDRGVTSRQLATVADNLIGYLASDALSSHLVDTLCFESDVRHMLKQTHGGKQLLPLDKYVAKVKSTPSTSKDKIAVIYAEGNVMDGRARGIATGVYGDDIVKALRQASDDKNVKAIVLRVNSPGGSATASESMTHAVRQAREKKPVVVSMGDLAASAGYEMSCLADAIVAQPTTITGSIGVFGTIPNISKLMRQKLGLATDTVSTNRNASGLTLFRPLSPTAKAMMERNVEDFYKVFLNRVAEGRGMTTEAVHRIARGRVWTGADAIGIGLVDTLGGIGLALDIAAQKAGIETYSIKEFPKEKDPWTQLSELFGDEPADDITLFSKMRMAVKWRVASRDWKPLSQLDQDIQCITGSNGLQARLPYVVIGD